MGKPIVGEAANIAAGAQERDRAAHLLNHYIRLAHQGDGRLDSDTTAEVEAIIAHVLDAAKYQARAEYEARLAALESKLARLVERLGFAGSL